MKRAECCSARLLRGLVISVRASRKSVRIRQLAGDARLFGLISVRCCCRLGAHGAVPATRGIVVHNWAIAARGIDPVQVGWWGNMGVAFAADFIVGYLVVIPLV